jgi:hypothetical protein
MRPAGERRQDRIQLLSGWVARHLYTRSEVGQLMRSAPNCGRRASGMWIEPSGWRWVSSSAA